MSKEKATLFHTEKLTLLPGITVQGPLGLDFFQADSASHPKLAREAAARRHLYDLTKAVLDDSQPFNNPTLLTELYQHLTTFLAADDLHGRLLLYLPEKLLPDTHQPAKTTALRQSEMAFVAQYQQSWLRLLFESNSRAAFVDGDVLEPGLGEPPTVRKAAHLLPDILAHGLVPLGDIADLYRFCDDPELVQSLSEGLIVAADHGLVSPDFLHHLGIEIPPVTTADNTPNSPDPLDYLRQSLIQIDLRYSPGSPFISHWSPARIKWDQQVQRDAAINRTAEILSQRLILTPHSTAAIDTLFTQRGYDHAYTLVALKGLFLAGQNVSAIVDTYLPLITNLWSAAPPTEIKNSIASGLNHWARLGLVSPNLLHHLNIPYPDLASPLPVSPRELFTGEFRYLTDVVQTIHRDPQLSTLFYPAILVFGSRVKGIADLAADHDLAVFLKPDTPWSQRQPALALLKEKNPSLNRLDKILEYWVSQKDGQLGLKPVPEGTTTVAGPGEIHFLIDGFWIGAQGGYETLYAHLAQKYLDLSRFGDQKSAVRSQLLHKLELDLLQFRLMHKGYRRFYPTARPVNAPHAALIDGDSDFWDPGYRRIATLLFLSRVFLPDISA
ncbi:hypothetical protein M1116_02070 [Patescibacteria group bacterium]|nr:hypothetical protein [Patescibacteria group bacterium]